MNPEQNGGQPVTPAASADPYDFIMNPGKPPKKPLLPSGNSVLQRIAIVGGGLVGLIIIVTIAASIISSGGKEKTQYLLATAQYQTELIRVATAGSMNATTIPAQNLAASVETSVSSDNAALLTYLKKNGLKVTPVVLTAKHSKTTDATLDSALQNNSYDTAFTDVIQTDLNDYLTELQRAYKTSTGPNGKKLLAGQFTSAKLLQVASKQTN